MINGDLIHFRRVGSKVVPFPDWLVIAGDWNGYNEHDFSAPWKLTRISAPGIPATPDGYNWYTNVIHVATTGGDAPPGVHSFVFVASKTWANQWGGFPLTSITPRQSLFIPVIAGVRLKTPSHWRMGITIHFGFWIQGILWKIILQLPS